jgi:hypothetical protein
VHPRANSRQNRGLREGAGVNTVRCFPCPELTAAARTGPGSCVSGAARVPGLASTEPLPGREVGLGASRTGSFRLRERFWQDTLHITFFDWRNGNFDKKWYLRLHIFLGVFTISLVAALPRALRPLREVDRALPRLPPPRMLYHPAQTGLRIASRSGTGSPTPRSSSPSPAPAAPRPSLGG